MPPEPQAELRQAIRDALRERSMTQEQLGQAVGRAEGKTIPQQSVAEWLSGRVTIPPHRIFTIERALGLRPGTLSRHEGYVPVGATPVVTPEDAIAADPDINDVYRGLLEATIAQARIQSLADGPKKRGRR